MELPTLAKESSLKPDGDVDGGTDACYELIPDSLNEMPGERKGLIFAHHQREMESHLEQVQVPGLHRQDYRYAIDKSTGNLLIIQNATNVPETSRDITTLQAGTASSSNLSLSGDTLALLQVLDDGQCVLEAASEQITFHSAEGMQSDGDGDESRLQGSSVMTGETGNQRQQVNEVPIRSNARALWSRRKIMDFIQCIHSHEQRLRKCSKIKGNVWNDISKDMVELGYHDCNKDECSKKWNNLYRTWKKVKLRPKEDRHKWQYFQQVTSVVKSISQRDRDKGSSKKTSILSSKALILQLMELNRKHQQNIAKVEQKFQEQYLLLDKERDAILNDIRAVLQT